MDIESDRVETVDERAYAATTMPPPTPNVAVAQEPAVAMPVVGQATVQTVRSSAVTPAAVVAGVVAVGLLVLGGVTAVRAGIDGTLTKPVVSVAGYTATALLGVIEIGFGLLLLLAALTRSRGSILFVAIAGFVLALVSAFQPSPGRGALAVEREFAVLAAVVMGVVVLASLLPTVRRSRVVRRDTDIG